MDSLTLNDAAWRTLFAKYGIPDAVERHGSYTITGKEIREFREPRLMAKFDHAVNLPKVFRDNSLAILPVSRSAYLISPIDCYQSLPAVTGVVCKAALPAMIESIDPRAITSEAAAVNCALASGVFTDFLGEATLVPTVCGRMQSGTFDFNITNVKTGQPFPVRVDKAQIEIDCALEAPGSLTLVEAKRDLSDDFIVRQVYYPFRTWTKRVAKPVRLVYLTHSNEIFTLYEFRVDDPERYNSLVLIQSARYSIEDTFLSMSDIDWVARSVTVLPEPEIPFPQADSFDRVINLCELLLNSPMTKDEVTEQYAFDARQTRYYLAACRYLGLVEKAESERPARYRLSERGEGILRLRYRQRQVKLCERILEHKVFNDLYALCRKEGKVPDKGTVVAAMKSGGLYGIRAESTCLRRSSTVRGWLEWMGRLTPRGFGQ